METASLDRLQRFVGFVVPAAIRIQVYSRLDPNASATRRTCSIAALFLELSGRFELSEQLAHVFWHLLFLVFVFAPQGTAKRHNRGSPKQYLFFFILVIHAGVNGTNTASFRWYKECDDAHQAARRCLWQLHL
jgi:hypothetical protein